MKVVVQRCTEAKVKVNHETVGQIDHGFMLLVGVTHADSEEQLQWIANKIVHLRVFEDEEGKMNRSLIDIGGDILSISQFTLYADCNKGRRPSFAQAAKPDKAKKLYDRFNELLREKGVNVETGIFGAEMDVHLINEGPVTLILER